MNRSCSLVRRIPFLTVLMTALCTVCLNHSANAQSYGTPDAMDLDGDGVVAVADLLILLGEWGTYPAGPPDFDGGGVGVTDLLALLSAWGPAGMQIGPIPGLTTAWHRAPQQTAIAVGLIVPFRVAAAPQDIVVWSGAIEISRDEQYSIATCPITIPDQNIVSVVIGAGGSAETYQSVMDVVDIPLDGITVSSIIVSPDPIEIDETLPPEELNEQTMDYFFGPSIAAIRDLGDNQYRTSIGRHIPMQIDVDPAEFAPLMEWRFDGQPARLMDLSAVTQFYLVGNHAVEVGPLLTPAEIDIETYAVAITSHVSFEDIVPDGVPIVFEAVTDPPGYEDDITWLSSTKYGTGYPILGEGPVFVTEFNNTWGPWPADPDFSFQWLGVKGDNNVFNQDVKCPSLPESPDNTGLVTPDPNKEGPPGSVVTYTFIISFDNCFTLCFCGGAPGAGFAWPAPTVVSQGPGNWAGAAAPPGGFAPYGPCPSMGAGCPPFPATVFATDTFTVSITIPLNASPGDSDTHTVTVGPIGGLPGYAAPVAMANVTTTAN